MKLLHCIILTLLTNSCDEEVKTTSTPPKEVIRIQLIDSLGSISIEQPPYTDTFFAWIRRSDCGKPCEEGRYRFQSKAFPVYKESGYWFVDEPQDSVLQLTILHSRNVYLQNNDRDFAIKYQEWFREILSDELRRLRILSDTVYLIGDRKFYVFRSFGFDAIYSTNVSRLDAFTLVKGNKIQFTYKQKMKDYNKLADSFLVESERNLRSVRFHDGG